MPVHLETTADARVAIIRGIHGDEALERLARDLAEGTALERYAGLVVDLGSGTHSTHALDALERASTERLRRHQVVCSSESSAVDETLQRVIRWRRMLTPPAFPRVPIVHELSAATTTVVRLIARPLVSSLRPIVRKAAGRTD